MTPELKPPFVVKESSAGTSIDDADGDRVLLVGCCVLPSQQWYFAIRIVELINRGLAQKNQENRHDPQP